MSRTIPVDWNGDGLIDMLAVDLFAVFVDQDRRTKRAVKFAVGKFHGTGQKGFGVGCGIECHFIDHLTKCFPLGGITVLLYVFNKQ